MPVGSPKIHSEYGVPARRGAGYSGWEAMPSLPARTDLINDASHRLSLRVVTALLLEW